MILAANTAADIVQQPVHYQNLRSLIRREPRAVGVSSLLSSSVPPKKPYELT